MKEVVIAKMQWVPPEKGGRKLVSTGITYAIPARFEDEAEKWPREAWSLVVELIEQPNESLEAVAEVSLLVGDEPNAPNHLLRPGGRFELLDGDTLVARGKVLG